MEADAPFHGLLFEASGNAILRQFVEQVTTFLQKARERVATPDRGKRSLVHHRLILHAVEGRDPEAAERHMREHL
jgi:DNA-binding FadR family transcriptional regulator